MYFAACQLLAAQGLSGDKADCSIVLKHCKDISGQWFIRVSSTISSTNAALSRKFGERVANENPKGTVETALRGVSPTDPFMRWGGHGVPPLQLKLLTALA